MTEIPSLLERARALLDRGERGQAKAAYLNVLMLDRYQCDAMLGLAELHIEDDDYESARVIALQAVERHPDSGPAHCILANALLDLGILFDACAAFAIALRIQPSNRKAWAGLGVAFERIGDTASADSAFRQAFDGIGPAVSHYRGVEEPVRVLVLWSATGGNVPLKPILDDRIFQWATLLVESFDEGMPLPPHDVVFNAVGDADLRNRALDMAERALCATQAPVINHPARVRPTGRTSIAQLLRDVPDVMVPQILSVPRETLLGSQAAALLAGAGFDWPLLVRSPGFHGGEHFVLVADAAALPEAVGALPGSELLVIAYVDARRADGAIRKYRVLSIGGRLYPLHAAVSHEWKIHYFSADLRPEYREEERAFLEDMQTAIGEKPLRALERIAGLLQLDYAGIDFTIDDTGRVVVFEANATMAIVPPGRSDEELYRRKPIGRAIAAAATMIATFTPTSPRQ